MPPSSVFITHPSLIRIQPLPKRRRIRSIHLCTEPNPNRQATTSPNAKPKHSPQTPSTNGAPPPSAPHSSHTPPKPPSPPPKPSSARRLIKLSIGPLSTAVPAYWLLYTVPFFWGSFGPAVRLLFAQPAHPDPSFFNSERLLLSTLFYIPVLLIEVKAYLNRNSPDADPSKSFAFVRAGIELGTYVFLANVAQVIGLQQTSASRAAFLVQLQTVIVPVLAGFLGIDAISTTTWLSSIVAVAGVALLSSDKASGAASTLTGDALEILSAMFFSTYIIRLSKFANNLPANPLVATKIVVQAALSIGWALLTELTVMFHNNVTDASEVPVDAVPWTFSDILVNIGVVLWTGLLSSAVAGWVQTKGQQGVPASEAVVIFAAQPLWASALAAVVLGESFGVKGYTGGALIVAATLIASRQSGNDKESQT